MFDVFYLNNATGLFPHEQRANSLEHACELSRTRYLWVVDGLNDYSRFDWLWEPVPWESDQTHVWPSQWQENGGTYLIPKSGVNDINRNHDIVLRKGQISRVGIDHGNGLNIDCEYSTRYISDYLGTLKRALSKVNEEYVWVVSSVCDYTDFDFTWHPSEWQLDMLHVFPSQDQRFGDTFFVHVPSFLKKVENLALLEWFDTIHFVEDISVKRRPIPVYHHEHDSQVPAVWEYDFRDPVVQFARYDPIGYDPVINLWRQETKAIVPLTPGASNVVVPREAKNFLKTQLYDYPVIDKSIANWPERLLDIVFISNGEPCAEQHWQWLQARVAPYYGSLRLHRVDGVNGRAAAYKAAAAASETDWFFAVFAKLEVDIDFPWDWQPDRLQAAKHYIFHAKNPVNGLEYGHQAMIAYNKQLVLNNPGKGLDFTLDDAHEVVPILSGVARYNYTPWIAWRTAFREVLKLKANLPDMESAYRIKQWTKETNTLSAVVNEDWSRYGALDAVEYYDTVNGDFDELKKSYEWDWLASYAFLKRNLLPDR
jgi:hypothetical protein